MNKRLLNGLLRNIGKLKPDRVYALKMNEKSLTGLLTTIKHSKLDLKEVANDEDLLFRAFIEGAQAKWTNNEGMEIRTSLEKFLTDDQVDVIIEQRQAEIRQHIDRLADLEAQFIFVINSRTRKDRREQILKALEIFFSCDQTNALIEQEQGETNDSVCRPGHLETLIADIIQRGTGQGRRRGIQSAETRLRDEFMVNTGRNYKKKYGNPPRLSRIVAKDGSQKIGGTFVRYANDDEDVPEHLTATQIAESLRRIKKLIKNSPDHPQDFFSEEHHPPEEVFSAFLKSNK